MGRKYKKCFASNCGLIASFGFNKKVVLNIVANIKKKVWLI